MNLPSKVKVGGHKFKVIFPYKFKERSDLNGQCDSILLEIRLAKFDSGGTEIAETKQLSNFLHELIHAIGFSFLSASEKSLEEVIVEGLAQGLMAVMIDNPKLFTDLLKSKCKD